MFLVMVRVVALSDGKGGGIRGVRYPIRFNSIFEFWREKKLFLQYSIQYCFAQD